MNETLPPVEGAATETVSPRSLPRRVMRMLGFGLIVTAVLLAWYLAVLYMGWQSGQDLLSQRREEEMQNQVARQVTLAQENVAEGSYTLALRRLDWVLERSPNQPEAVQLQEQAQAALNQLLTPQTTILAATPQAETPTPLPMPTAGPIENPLSEWQRIRRLAVNKAWADVVPALVAFQRQFPSYERADTDALLYEAYIELGLQLLEGEQVEVGLFYLEQAESLGDLSQEVLDYQVWGELYLQGLAFYDVNWAAATFYFRDLCLAAPFYQSSCDRLHEALAAYGDQFASAQDWCPAQEMYAEALTHGRTQSLIEKNNEAREFCLLATPTPLPTATFTAPITDTQTITNPLRSFVTPTPKDRP
ncbi:MAG: hypothetical protein ACE5FD_12085 [Anaerolineae bacterium]